MSTGTVVGLITGIVIFVASTVVAKYPPQGPRWRWLREWATPEPDPRDKNQISGRSDSV
jgi:hypothetical protein